MNSSRSSSRIARISSRAIRTLPWNHADDAGLDRGKVQLGGLATGDAEEGADLLVLLGAAVEHLDVDAQVARVAAAGVADLELELHFGLGVGEGGTIGLERQLEPGRGTGSGRGAGGAAGTGAGAARGRGSATGPPAKASRRRRNRTKPNKAKRATGRA
jgi:hypothetical protein